MRTPVFLLVDDEPEILRALARAFRGKPYTILTARSAEEAMRIAESTRVDLVISDFRMPGMDGIELLRRLMEVRPRTIRILISGYAEAERVLAACHKGEVDRFIPKPWEVGSLLGVVRSLLDARAIRERKDYLEALLDSSPDAILIIDREARIVLVNPTGTELLRRPSEDLQRVEVSALLWGGAAEYQALARGLSEEGRVLGHETRLKVPGGSVPVSISLSSFRDNRGRARGVVLILKDISARKSNERALRRANRQLRKANTEVRRAADEISRLHALSRRLAAISDIDHLFEVTAPALLEQDLAHLAGLVVTGASESRGILYAPEEMDEDTLEEGLRTFTGIAGEGSCAPAGKVAAIRVLRTPGGSIPTEDAGRHADMLLPLAVTGKPLGHLWLRRHGKEPYSPIQEQLLKTIALEVAATMNRLLEVESGERRRIQALVEGMSEPVIMLDENFGLLCLHPRARGLLGMTEGQTDLDLSRLEPPPLAQLFQRAARDRRHAIEEEIVLPLPTPRICRVVITPVTREGGRLLGTVAVFQDVTQWREAEQIKSEFVANVSHELRTPLTSIKEATSLLMDGVLGEVTGKQRDCLQIVAAECGRLSRLVNDILELSRIEAARICLNRTYGSFTATAKAALDSLGASARNAGIALSMEAPQRIPTLLFDPDRVTQILVNLIGNAIKFTPRGGNVRLVIENDPRQLTVRVIDSGEGIPPGEAARIFDKFYRGDSAVVHAKQGTGLGLPICKALVEMHGGTIGVRSEIARGAEFRFTLPRITARRALVDHVTSVLERARREEQSVGIIALLVGGAGRGETGDPLLLERARSIVEKGIYKAQDRIFTRDSRALIMVLPDADATALRAVAGRLDGMLRKTLGEKYLAGRFRWQFAAYPEDGHTAKELLRHLSRSKKGDPSALMRGPKPAG